MTSLPYFLRSNSRLMRFTAAIAANVILTNPCLQAAAPDAGQTLQQLQPQPELPQTSPALELQAPATRPPLAGGAPFTLTRINLISTAFPAEELLALVKDAYGQRLDLAGLNALAERITAYYRAHGYLFAVALVPPQTLKEGEVTFDIIEGRYGRVTTSGDSAAEAADWLTRLQPGTSITQGPLERSLRVLDRVPGVTVNPVVQPGRQIGEGDLEVGLRRERFGGAMGLSNHGNRYTGQAHASAGLWAGGLLTFGDRIALDALLTDESLWLGALNYDLPLGTNGLRAQVGYAHTHYELGEEFANLDASGNARIASAGLSYPLALTLQGGVEMTLDYKHKRLHDTQGAVSAATDKSSNSLRAAALFDWRDRFLGDGVTWGSLALTHGRLSLDDSSELIDAASARTQGDFDTIALDLSRVQRIAGPLSLFGRIAAQWASKNLDSSESFGLGGAYGVRAYPTGEGYGDEGALLQLEARYRVGTFTPYALYDAGRVRIDAKQWSPGRNRRDLSGAGFGLRWNNSRMSADANVAWRVSGDASTADPHDRSRRIWAGLQSHF